MNDCTCEHCVGARQTLVNAKKFSDRRRASHILPNGKPDAHLERVMECVHQVSERITADLRDAASMLLGLLVIHGHELPEDAHAALALSAIAVMQRVRNEHEGRTRPLEDILKEFDAETVVVGSFEELIETLTRAATESRSRGREH